MSNEVGIQQVKIAQTLLPVFTRILIEIYCNRYNHHHHYHCNRRCRHHHHQQQQQWHQKMVSISLISKINAIKLFHKILYVRQNDMPR